ncbi:MAG: adenylate cyclase, partial [Candidatus Marinamargulisbacteria bacterium]
FTNMGLNSRRFFLNKKAWFFSILAFSVSLALLTAKFDGLSAYNLDAFDYYSRQVRQSAIPNPDVKIVLIDEHSVTTYGESLGRWPWPRAVYKDIISFINMGNPKAIIFDLLFSEEEADQSSHALFLEGLKSQDNIHLGMVFVSESDVDHVDKRLPDSIRDQFSVDVPGAEHLYLRSYNNFIIPLNSFHGKSKSIPVFTIHSDSDGIYRRSQLLFRYNDKYYPSAALSLVREMGHSKRLELLKNRRLAVGPYTVPLDRNGEIMLNWYPQGFEALSISGLFASWQYILDGEVEKVLVDPETFKDAIVIIGASALGLHDLKATPISEKMAGSEVIATLISNILNDEVVKVAPGFVSILSTILIIGVMAYSVLFFPPILKYSIPLLYLGLNLAGSFLLFKETFWFMPVADTVVFGLLSFLLSLIYVNCFELMEKNKIRRTFSKYLSPEVMKEVLKNYDELVPEVGKKVKTTVLFCDIRNFTSISENFPVEKVVHFLNDYFEVMIAEIHQSQGTLDKLIGDAIMAFWNAPIDVSDHVDRAISTAFKMQEIVKKKNPEWQKMGLPEIEIGIGINTGDAIIGNIGSKSRLDYTAIGDTVNLASRLESLCKVYNSPIVISEGTRKQMKDGSVCRVVDRVQVRGKQKPLLVYEPRSQSEITLVNDWQAFYTSFCKQNWRSAESEIDTFCAKFPSDKLALIYRARVQKYLKQPPGPNWTGVTGNEAGL